MAFPIDMTPEQTACVIANLRIAAKIKYRHLPNWALVRDAFGVGSNKACEVCQYAGIDPNSRSAYAKIPTP